MAFFLETLFGGLMVGMLYSLIALGFVLIYKASGVFNFAQGAMVLFAALAMARMSAWLPKWLGFESQLLANLLAIVVAMAVMVAVAWIIERLVLPGQKIMAGEPLLVIADLSTVWADADIYQSDLPYVKVGMRVELSLPYWSGKKFTGQVTFVSPTLDAESRTLKARLEIPNPEVLLKPGMFAAAQLSYELGEGLAIPEAAVMRTAQQTYAFRDASDGRLVPTPIVVGERSDGYYQLVSGLSEGDKVASIAKIAEEVAPPEVPGTETPPTPPVCRTVHCATTASTTLTWCSAPTPPAVRPTTA